MGKGIFFWGGGRWMMFGMKKVISFQDAVVVEVRDVAAAQQWYSEKLGLRYSSTEVEQASVVLGYSDDDAELYLVEISGNERSEGQSGKPPIIFASKLAAAHEYLSSRGVAVGPLQTDSGGNRFFRFRDLEGNELEICQEF
jgi:catechol 2,3-dioxygenase-like lactoylglutathione lyase family enzyme